MADDIRENAMSGGTPARLRGLDANGNSISPTLAEVENALPKMSCIYHKVWTASKGDLLVVKSSYSIFMVGDSASGSHIMGITYTPLPPPFSSSAHPVFLYYN